jgi:diguanylate cyclase (GGDEF)-like protein/PAS domain S-box-containing protein
LGTIDCSLQLIKTKGAPPDQASMTTYNTYYSDPADFSVFLRRHRLKDNPRLLVQVFTAVTEERALKRIIAEIASMLPAAAMIGATTDGEICSGVVSTGKTVVSLTQFVTTALRVVQIDGEHANSYQKGQKMAKRLFTPKTAVAILFADGLRCNGEAFLNGIISVDANPLIAGGLAGDNGRFEHTFVFSAKGPSKGGAVGVALDNPRLHVHTDYSFNWQPIGREMRITRVDGNRVYTIDDVPAYDLYKKYLGEDVAQKLPQIGIEFPLIIRRGETDIARAVLSKHKDGSLSFGGNFRPGDTVTFGYGDVQNILLHAEDTLNNIAGMPVESLFIYSCMARRRFMPAQVQNEIIPLQSVADVAGFFTYSEFFSHGESRELFNQTMTLIGLSESEAPAEKHAVAPRKQNGLNEYQKTTKALSHLLNVTTREMAESYRLLENRNKIIKAKREALERAQSVGHFGSWEIDLITKKSVWSDESYRIYKLDPETTQPTLDTFMSRVIPEDLPKARSALASLTDGKIKSIDLRVRRTDGVIITVLLNGKMLFDEKKRPVKLIGTTLDITEQVKLREKNEEFAAIIEDSTSEVYIVERGTNRFLYVNAQALKTLGYTREEMYGMTIFDINSSLTPEHAKYIESKLLELGSFVNKTEHVRKDGSRYPVHSFLQHKKFDNKDVAIIFDMDVTKLVESEKRQKQQAQILEQINDAVISTDLNGIITHWNNGATALHGYTADEMIGKSIGILYLPDDEEQFRFMRQQALSRGGFRDQIRKRTKRGDIIYANVSISLLKDDAGNVIGLTRYSQDITQRKEIEDKLRAQTALLNHQAYHDTLTELPNRALFEDRLQQSINNALRREEDFALFFIDLDNFKQINDTLGHHVGDEVLKVIAKRVAGCIKEGDTLARLGGDEFTVILQDIKASENAAAVAQKIIHNLKPKIKLGPHELHVSASIGISLFPKDSVLKDDLLRFADTAMYKAKDEGRSHFQFYSRDMTLLAFEKAMMEASLHKAIEKKQFVVYYQPQIDARNNSIYGVEALVRWHHPEMGVVLPDKFIPLAEETNFIKVLDSYVMRQAMQDLRDWYDAGLRSGMLSLNLSIKQFTGSIFVNELTALICETGFDVRWLELEITESQMMLNPMQSIEILNTLNEMGINIAIDDFGTGYSSLAYLKRLPVHKLKIDQSFIMGLPEDEEDCAITDAVIALAKSMNIAIVAEGAEKSEQVAYLLEQGCHFIQGYYYTKPLPKAEMARYIERNAIIPFFERRADVTP